MLSSDRMFCLIFVSIFCNRFKLSIISPREKERNEALLWDSWSIVVKLGVGKCICDVCSVTLEDSVTGTTTALLGQFSSSTQDMFVPRCLRIPYEISPSNDDIRDILRAWVLQQIIMLTIDFDSSNWHSDTW